MIQGAHNCIIELVQHKMYDELQDYLDDMNISSIKVDWIWTINCQVLLPKCLKRRIHLRESRLDLLAQRWIRTYLYGI